MKTTLLRILVALAIASSARSADTSISALPAISSVTATTIVPVVDTAGTPTTKKANVAQLISGLPAATGSSDGKLVAADKALLDTKTASATANAMVRRDASGNASFNLVTMAQGTVTNPPLSSTDIANKGYVDSAAAGLSVKAPCVAATTANITLAGGAPTTTDGVTLIANNRVLVKDQTDPKENGIYFVQTLGTGANGTWVRTTDADTGAELVTGSYTFVYGGTVSANTSYVMTTAGTIVIGTSNIVWVLYTQVTNILAANIIGQLVSAQIADAAITTAKFASGLTPVEILGTLPSSGNFTGRQVLLTTDGKLYRYISGAFTSAEAASDITGTITTTQIADNSISTAKLQANSVTATNIAASAITAGKIAASAVTAGTIAAGAVNTTELAASAVNASKILAGSITTTQIAASTILGGNIAAGTITASNLSVSTLSAISANLGTVTAGTLSAVTINSATLNTPTGNIGGFTISVNNLGGTNGNYNMALSPPSGGTPSNLVMNYSGSQYVSLTETTAGGLLQLGKSGTSTNIQLVGETGIISVGGGSPTAAMKATNGIVLAKELASNNGDGWTPKQSYSEGGQTISFQWTGSALKVRIDSTELTVDTH